MLGAVRQGEIPEKVDAVDPNVLKDLQVDRRILEVTADQAAAVLKDPEHPLNLLYYRQFAKPVTWVAGKNADGRSTRHIFLPEKQKGPIVIEDILVNQLPIEESLRGRSDGLIYEVWVDEYGIHDTNPEVSTKRMARLIRHKDMKSKPNIVVTFPGFAHTHRFHDTRWFLSLLAQAANIKKCNFLFVNPMGKGLPGYDGAGNIANLTADQITEDTSIATMRILDAITETYGVTDRVNVVSMGHSLGARLARAFAANLIKSGQKKYRLTGVIQEAGTSASRLGNLTPTYIKAIFPHLKETLRKMYAVRRLHKDQPGKNFTFKDIRDLFINGFGIPENLFFVALSLQDGEVGNFWDLTVNNNDMDEFLTTIEASLEGIQSDEFGLGNKHIIFNDDTNFDHRHDKTQRTPESVVYKVESGVPHSYVVPIPTVELMQKVARMLEFELGIGPFSLKVPSHPANQVGPASDSPIPPGVTQKAKKPRGITVPETFNYEPVSQQLIIDYMDSRRSAPQQV